MYDRSVVILHLAHNVCDGAKPGNYNDTPGMHVRYTSVYNHMNCAHFAIMQRCVK